MVGAGESSTDDCNGIYYEHIHMHQHDSSTHECNEGAGTVICCWLGCEAVQNVGLVLLRPVFLSGHSVSASNIRESETVK